MKRATTRILNNAAKRLIPLGMYEFRGLELSNSGGIGMLDTNSRTFSELRHNLDVHVISYLTKAEQYLALKLSKGGKLIGRGLLPQVNRAGRPRLAASARLSKKDQVPALRSTRLRMLRKGSQTG